MSITKRIQKELNDTKTQLQQLQAYKDAGFPQSSNNTKSATVKKIDTMEAELADLKSKIEIEAHQITASAKSKIEKTW